MTTDLNKQNMSNQRQQLSGAVWTPWPNTHLANEIKQVEDSNENNGHPAAETTAHNLWLDARKQGQCYKVDNADGHHVRPDALRHLKPHH